MGGHYKIIADFGNGVIVEKGLDISFNVIPESMIGTIALMGSSLAALGGFVLLRRRPANRHNGSLGNQGI